MRRILFPLLSLILGIAVPAALAEKPESYEEAVELGRSLVDRRAYADAVKVLRKASKMPGAPTAEGLILLAESYAHVGAYKDAAEASREAIELAEEPHEQALAYNSLGAALFAGGHAKPEELEEAAVAMRRAVEIDPRDLPVARFNLGLTLLKLGRDEEGIAVLEKLVEQWGTSSLAAKAKPYIENPLRARVPMIPDFEIATLGGEYLTAEELRGKVVLLDFWGTWCKPCVAAVPHLRQLSRRMKKDPFVIVSISSDAEEATLRAFVEEHEMSWPQIWDRRREIQSALEVNRFPTYVLVDPEGVIVSRHSGFGASIQREIDHQTSAAIRRAKKAQKKGQ